MTRATWRHVEAFCRWQVLLSMASVDGKFEIRLLLATGSASRCYLVNISSLIDALNGCIVESLIAAAVLLWWHHRFEHFPSTRLLALCCMRPAPSPLAVAICCLCSASIAPAAPRSHRPIALADHPSRSCVPMCPEQCPWHPIPVLCFWDGCAASDLSNWLQTSRPPLSKANRGGCASFFCRCVLSFLLYTHMCSIRPHALCIWCTDARNFTAPFGAGGPQSARPPSTGWPTRDAAAAVRRHPALDKNRLMDSQAGFGSSHWHPIPTHPPKGARARPRYSIPSPIIRIAGSKFHNQGIKALTRDLCVIESTDRRD